MAKTGVLDTDPPAASRAAELKKELQRLVRAIVEDEDYSVEAIDQARQALLALREFKTKRGAKPMSLKLRGAVSCPEEFLCPLSKELMKDPVIVATGQTYDRAFIQKWLKAGNRTCPQTQQVLSHTTLTPNHLIRDMITKWCKNQGIDLSDPVHYIDEDSTTEADRVNFLSLIQKMSSTIPEQKEAAKELRRLTKRMPSFRTLFGQSPDAIAQLLNPLAACRSPGGRTYLDLQEDVITTILNLSIHDNNKQLVTETPDVIISLMDALRTGTIETRSNAAAALFTLSALNTNKKLIGDSGALRPLIELLDEGHPLAMTDAASAIFNLCMLNENKALAVQDGAVRVILRKIEDRNHVDELLALLAMLSIHQSAVDEMAALGAVPCLLRVMRETSCGRNKENCIAILHTICHYHKGKLEEINAEENAHRTISELSRNGTSRAKRKAVEILEKIRRAAEMLERMHRRINFTNTA